VIGSMQKGRRRRRKRRLVLAVVSVCFGLGSASPAIAQKDPASAAALLELHRYREAKALLEQAVRDDERDVKAQYYLGRAYFALCEYDKAITAMRQAVQLQQDKALYHYWLGRAYGEKAKRVGTFKKASLAAKIRKEFEQAVALDPHDAGARVALGNFYAQAPAFMGGGTRKALAQAAALTELDPLRGKLLAARIDEQEKEIARAADRYKALAQQYAGSANAAVFFSAYGRFLFRQKRYNDAIEAFGERLKRDPRNPGARLRLAAAYEAADRPQDAEAQYRQVAAVSARCVPVKYRRAGLGQAPTPRSTRQVGALGPRPMSP